MRCASSSSPARGNRTSRSTLSSSFRPVALARQTVGVFWLADLVGFGSCSKQASELVYEGLFTPPSLKGSLTYPGMNATAGCRPPSPIPGPRGTQYQQAMRSPSQDV